MATYKKFATKYWDYQYFHSSSSGTVIPGTASSEAEAEAMLKAYASAASHVNSYYSVQKSDLTGYYIFKSLLFLPDDISDGTTSFNCVVVDGTIRFGKMPTLSGLTATYDQSGDEIEFEWEHNLTWGTGSWTVYAEINDTTPDINVGTQIANTIYGLGYIENARATYGTGTKTLYVRLYYDGVYSNTVSVSVTLTAPAPKAWGYIETVSSEPYGVDASVSGAYGDDWTVGRDDLELEEPASGFDIGDIGVAFDTNTGNYYVFECEYD